MFRFDMWSLFGFLFSYVGCVSFSCHKDLNIFIGYSSSIGPHYAGGPGTIFVHNPLYYFS